MRCVVFTATAVRQFKRLPRAARPLLLEAIQRQLAVADPLETTRNKFRLRRPSEHADFELRVNDLRVFYRVEPDEVVITVLGEKQGSRLIVDGEELEL